MKSKVTYRDAGVDVDAGNAFVTAIKPHVKTTQRPEVLGGLGGFGALFKPNLSGLKSPVLVSATDGVGTKLKIAFLCGKHDTVGIDLVAMNVNDIVVQGAEPLFFLDYLATGHLKVEEMASVVAGIAEGCRQAGCALIGGETAEMPGFYGAEEYDLAGFCVGMVDQERIITGETIKPGDTVLGLASSGLHSNGYSLARKIVFERNGLSASDLLFGDKTVADVLLTPTRIYVKSILALYEKVSIKGLVHITGGGFTDNIPRILPQGLGMELALDSVKAPEIFSWLAANGPVEREDMLRTFNMGVGMIVILSAGDVAQAKEILASQGEVVYELGQVTDSGQLKIS